MGQGRGTKTQVQTIRATFTLRAKRPRKKKEAGRVELLLGRGGGQESTRRNVGVQSPRSWSRIDMRTPALIQRNRLIEEIEGGETADPPQ